MESLPRSRLRMISTTGINEKIIKRYIERQGEEDRGQTEFAF
jgi:hypothetical protein